MWDVRIARRLNLCAVTGWGEDIFAAGIAYLESYILLFHAEFVIGWQKKEEEVGAPYT